MTTDVTTPMVEEAPFVPSFDDEAESGRKLAIICSKGNLDMAYPALILGNAALGEGIEVHLFFTFWGFDMINRKTQGDLQFSYLGNTAMHPPGMFGVHMPQGMASLPGMTAATTKMMKKQIADLDVPEVPEFLEMIHASGGHLWACRMSADMMKLHEEDLIDEVEGIISASDFMEITDGAQLLFI
ncbi:DsrE/DsrF/DrsH-like family protein [Nocardioides sp. S5]|uniref:DsrE/DsrF/DrsH-like family protein n=1 Tax=Nocardioides sp. S5 TaxID=2017486 RepID=UPI001F5D7A40|nr:DsrE/DsrF/DrsH-like family protein [Nocardioides sp. S5]